MKEFLMGFISGAFLVYGFGLWVSECRVAGIVVILFAWFSAVIVGGHYLLDKKR